MAVREFEERLTREEARPTTMPVNTTPPQKSAPANEKPKWERVLPSYRDLHQPKPPSLTPPEEKPLLQPEKKKLGDISLVEAMLLPYYWSLYQLEKEKPAPGVEIPTSKSPKTAEAKRAVEAVMFPLYQTLSQGEPNGLLPAVDKTDEDRKMQLYRDFTAPHTPGCARTRHPLKPF